MTTPEVLVGIRRKRLGHAGGVMPTVEEMVEAAKKALKEGK